MGLVHTGTVENHGDRRVTICGTFGPDSPPLTFGSPSVTTVKYRTPQSDTLGPISIHHPAHLAAFEPRQVRVADGRPAPVSKAWTQLVNWNPLPPSSPRIEDEVVSTRGLDA